MWERGRKQNDLKKINTYTYLNNNFSTVQFEWIKAVLPCSRDIRDFNSSVEIERRQIIVPSNESKISQRVLRLDTAFEFRRTNSNGQSDIIRTRLTSRKETDVHTVGAQMKI